MMNFNGPSRNTVERGFHGNDQQSQDMSVRVPAHNKQQKQQAASKFCLPGSFAVNRVLAMEAAAAAAKAKPASPSVTPVAKPTAAPTKSAAKSTEKSAARPQEKSASVVAAATANNAVKPLANLKIMDSILGGKPKKTTRIQISMKRATSPSENSSNNNNNNKKGSTPTTVTGAKTITPAASAKSVSSLSSLGSKSSTSQASSPLSTAATITNTNTTMTSPRRVSVVSTSSSSIGPSVRSSSKTNKKSTNSPLRKTNKKSTTSPLRKTGRSKAVKKIVASSAASVSTTSTSASSKTKKEGLVPTPYDLTFCAEDDCALFQTVHQKIREDESPIRYLVNAIEDSSLLYSESWVIYGQVHDKTFTPETLDNESMVLALNKKILCAKADTAVLHKLCKDLDVTDMVKEVVREHGWEKDYPKIAKEDSRLLAEKTITNLKCILFLARFHCSKMYCNSYAPTTTQELDPNLKHVIQKCLSIVEGYVDVTPKKKRGRKKKVENDMVAAKGEETVDTPMETGPAQRVSVLEGDKESLPVASTEGDAAVVTDCLPNEKETKKKKRNGGEAVVAPNDVEAKKKKKKKRRVVEDDDEDKAALPLKKRKVAVSVDSFPALEDLVATNVATGPEEQKYLVEVETYLKKALQVVQRRRQALALYENNHS